MPADTQQQLEVDPYDGIGDETFEDKPMKKKMKLPTAKKFINGVFPPSLWVPDYKNDWKDKFAGDLRAGLTIGILLIPQGLAYALLAELPVQYGLFSAFMPPLIYGLLGSSRELSTAPVAVVSLLTSSGISQLYDPVTEQAQYITAAISLALLLGIIQFFMGVFRLGFIVNFLSHPVLSGFTSASALIIGLSQLKHVLGISTERSSEIHEVLESTFEHIKDTNGVALGIALGSMAILLIWKYTPKSVEWFHKYFKIFPSAMIVVVLMTVISSQLHLHDNDGVSIVGEVPAGLPSPKVPSSKDFSDLIVLALTITIISYMESMAIAKKFADNRNYALDYNQELIALGAANIVGSFFLSYPTTGGFSRTAVNANAGAKTQAAGIIGVIVVMIGLLAATDLFFDLPKAVLGAIVIVAVAPLVDVMEPIRLWKVSKVEAFLLVLTFALTGFVGVELGVGVSVLLSLLVVVWQASRPHFTLLGQLNDTDVYRNINRYKDAQEIPGVKIFRFDANIFFANVGLFEKQLRKRCFVDGVKFVILDLSASNGIDSSGLHLLEKAMEISESHGSTILFAGLRGPVRDLLMRAGFVEHVGMQYFLRTVHAAVLYAKGVQMGKKVDAADATVLDMPGAPVSVPVINKALTEDLENLDGFYSISTV